MQLDSVIVRASSPADVRRLCRAGGEVWQECGQVTRAGGIAWRYCLVKISAATAIRLRLVTPGAELTEMASSEDAPLPTTRTTGTASATRAATVRRSRHNGQGRAGGDAA